MTGATEPTRLCGLFVQLLKSYISAVRQTRSGRGLTGAVQAHEGDMNYTSDMFKAAFGAGVVVLALCFSASFAAAHTCVEPPSGLVSWWPGDGDANDIVGGDHGALQNGATFANGVVGQAFSFDGVDDFVSVPHAASQNIRAALTIDAWVMKKGPCQRLNCIVLMKEDVPAPGEQDLRYGLLIFDEGGIAPGRVSLSLNTGIWQDVAISTTVLQENVWYHIAGTYDGGAARIYVNGILENSVEKSGLVLPSTGGAIKIGQESAVEDPEGAEFFNGLIDEVELYSRALSAEEIAALYDAGSAGKCKGAAFIEIDIRPFSKSNNVNPKSRGVLLVAVLGSGEFDATQVDSSTVHFGPGEASPVRDSRVVDVNHDGYLDTLLYFNKKATGIRCGDDSASLSGSTFGGQRFAGSDSIRTVGCKKLTSSRSY
jgi:hypothetical protein